MKILQANKFFFRNGGSETVMFQERDFLIQNGHQVIDFSMHDTRNIDSNYADFFVENRQYHTQGVVGKLKNALTLIHSPQAVRQLSNLIKFTQPDIMHCHNIYHQLTPSIIGVAKKYDIPVVLTLHDYKTVCPTYNRLRDNKACSNCLAMEFRNVLIHRCAEGSLTKSALLYAEATVQNLLGSYQKVDLFITPSQFMQSSIESRFPESRTTSLYNGVDTKEINQSDKDDGYVLYIGRLVPEKGVETLLKAHMKSEGKWRVVVAGTGPMENVLKTKYNPSILVGYLDGENLRDSIAKASVVVVPSEWYENCPMSVLEAMANGKPVVASRIGGIPELVEDGVTGLLFEPGNFYELSLVLDKLMASPSLRKRMGTAGRSRVEKLFSLDEHNSNLIKIYENVLGT